MGADVIIIYGDPDYYSKTGFVPAETYGVRNGENQCAAALLACLLKPEAAASIKGRYSEGPAYELPPVTDRSGVSQHGSMVITPEETAMANVGLPPIFSARRPSVKGSVSDLMERKNRIASL